MLWFAATFLLMKSRDKLVKSNVAARLLGWLFVRHASENKRRTRFPSGPDNSGASLAVVSAANSQGILCISKSGMDRSFLTRNPVLYRFTKLFTALLITFKHVKTRTSRRKQNDIAFLRAFGRGLHRFIQRLGNRALRKQAPGCTQFLAHLPEHKRAFHTLREQRTKVMELESLVLAAGDQKNIRLAPASSGRCLQRLLNCVHVHRFGVVDERHTASFGDQFESMRTGHMRLHRFNHFFQRQLQDRKSTRLNSS